jgi:hypothetical protein
MVPVPRKRSAAGWRTREAAGKMLEKPGWCLRIVNAGSGGKGCKE